VNSSRGVLGRRPAGTRGWSSRRLDADAVDERCRDPVATQPQPEVEVAAGRLPHEVVQRPCGACPSPRGAEAGGERLPARLRGRVALGDRRRLLGRGHGHRDGCPAERRPQAHAVPAAARPAAVERDRQELALLLAGDAGRRRHAVDRPAVPVEAAGRPLRGVAKQKPSAAATTSVVGAARGRVARVARSKAGASRVAPQRATRRPRASPARARSRVRGHSVDRGACRQGRRPLAERRAGGEKRRAAAHTSARGGEQPAPRREASGPARRGNRRAAPRPRREDQDLAGATIAHRHDVPARGDSHAVDEVRRQRIGTNASPHRNGGSHGGGATPHARRRSRDGTG
jgi:hypothetical protein